MLSWFVTTSPACRGAGLLRRDSSGSGGVIPKTERPSNRLSLTLVGVQANYVLQLLSASVYPLRAFGDFHAWFN